MAHKVWRWMRPGAFTEDLREITGPVDAALRRLSEIAAKKPAKYKAPPIKHDSDEFRILHI